MTSICFCCIVLVYSEISAWVYCACSLLLAGLDGKYVSSEASRVCVCVCVSTRLCVCGECLISVKITLITRKSLFP